MVEFIQHQYTFQNLNKQPCFNLLNKLYGSIRCSVLVGTKKYEGRVETDWFETLPHAEEYEVTTEKIWSKCATVRILDECSPCKTLFFQQNDKGDPVVSKKIDSVVADRSSRGDQEIFIRSEYECQNTDLLTNSLKNIKNHDNITSLYPYNKGYVVVLKNRYPLMVDLNGVRDCSLPIFDIDDGFIDGPDEWNEEFKIWRNQFEQSGGAIWDKPILTRFQS